MTRPEDPKRNGQSSAWFALMCFAAIFSGLLLALFFVWLAQNPGKYESDGGGKAMTATLSPPELGSPPSDTVLVVDDNGYLLLAEAPTEGVEGDYSVPVRLATAVEAQSAIINSRPIMNDAATRLIRKLREARIPANYDLLEQLAMPDGGKPAKMAVAFTDAQKALNKWSGGDGVSGRLYVQTYPPGSNSIALRP